MGVCKFFIRWQGYLVFGFSGHFITNVNDLNSIVGWVEGRNPTCNASTYWKCWVSPAVQPNLRHKRHKLPSPAIGLEIEELLKSAWT